MSEKYASVSAKPSWQCAPHTIVKKTSVFRPTRRAVTTLARIPLHGEGNRAAA